MVKRVAKRPNDFPAPPAPVPLLPSIAVLCLAASILIATAVAGFLFVHYHHWHYDKEGHLVVRTDTVTGRTEVLYARSGWVPVGGGPAR